MGNISVIKIPSTFATFRRKLTLVKLFRRGSSINMQMNVSPFQRNTVKCSDGNDIAAAIWIKRSWMGMIPLVANDNAEHSTLSVLRLILVCG